MARLENLALLATVLLVVSTCDDSPTTPEQTGEVEEGIWGEHDVIDIHAHIGTFRGFDLSLPTLLENLERYGVNEALISNIRRRQSTRHNLEPR